MPVVDAEGVPVAAAVVGVAIAAGIAIVAAAGRAGDLTQMDARDVRCADVSAF